MYVKGPIKEIEDDLVTPDSFLKQPIKEIEDDLVTPDRYPIQPIKEIEDDLVMPETDRPGALPAEIHVLTELSLEEPANFLPDEEEKESEEEMKKRHLREKQDMDLIFS